VGNTVRKVIIAAVAALAAITLSPTTAPVAHADGLCDPGYVVGVPISDGRLPVKCVPKGNVPPGYVDGTGGNAQPVPGTGHGAGFKTDPPPNDPYGHNGPCDSRNVHVSKIDPQTGNAIEVWVRPAATRACR
jgi:hypothetical protein